MPMFQHVGRNTEIDGKRIPNGEGVYVEDDRELDKLFLNKFKRVKGTPGTQVINLADLEGKPAPRVGQSRGVIDGGPSQPLAPNQSLDQRAANSGVRPLRDPGAVGTGGFEGNGPAGGGTQGTRPSPDPEGREEPHAESAKTTKKDAKKILKAGGTPEASKRKAAGDGGDKGWEDVTADFEKAGKADLCVVKYPDGGFQVFDADDKDNDDAHPLNKGPLKTEKQVESFLDRYKHG